MRKKICFLIYPLLIMGMLLVFASSCKEDDENNAGNNTGNNSAGTPVLTTTAVTNITTNTANSGGNITSNGGTTVTTRGVCWSTGQIPTISDNKTTDGTGAGTFISNISGLSHNTLYYVRAYAINSKGIGYGNTVSFTTQQNPNIGSFTDTRDGNVYQTVTIGNQVWMAENLRYLPSVVEPYTGSNSTIYYYVYGYDSTDIKAAKAIANYTTYGVLYNWSAAMAGAVSSTTNPSGVQGVCPEGWHLPSDAEWTELTDYLGSDAGGKLKETSTTHWRNPNTGASNITGFTALPGGYRNNNGKFLGISYYGYWWSATDYGTSTAWLRSMYYNYSYISRDNNYKELGYCVRCVKD